ncbi:MAG: glycosyltransferase [Cyanobacteria bacterium J06607_10]
MGFEDNRLLIVVEDADYREPLARIFMPDRLVTELSGQLRSVDLHILTAAARWSEHAQEVAIFSCQSSDAYSEVSYLKIRLMGSGLGPTAPGAELVRLVSDFCPTHIVMCTQSPSLLRWAVRRKLRTVVLLSDWQEPLGGWLAQWRHQRFIHHLNRKTVNWVGGHGVHACKILEASGIDAGKIIPWEWPQPQLMAQYPPKQIRIGQTAVTLAYVGPLQPSAGIDDLLKAASLLQQQRDVSLHLICERPSQASITGSQDINSQDIERLQSAAAVEGLSESVQFWTDLSPEQMLMRVHGADLMVIPQLAQSLPAVPFSLSLAMAARTPIVACDHPYFVNHLFHNVNAMLFPLGNAKSMAHRIERVMGQPALYAQLSELAEIDLHKLTVPARWAELIEQWLQDSKYDQQRLRNFALSSGRYQNLERLSAQAKMARRLPAS